MYEKKLAKHRNRSAEMAVPHHSV